jgi:hypothetical protein
MEETEDETAPSSEEPEVDETQGLPKRVPHDWEEDEKAFGKHFGIAYDNFTQLILLLTPDQHKKYERTLKVNKEAAILWALHEGKSHGLLGEDE